MIRHVSHLVLITIMAFMMVLPAVQSVKAQTGQFSQFRKSEVVEPDTSKNEISVIDDYLGDTLFKRTTRYNDGRVSTVEFHANGLAKAEMIVSDKGVTTIKIFATDGKGLIRETVVTKDKFELLDFRIDGVTIWTKQVFSPDERYTQYYDKAGVLKLKREFSPSGSMLVTVFDQTGNLAYKQVWIPQKAGYVLELLEEPLSDGTFRRLSIKNGKVSHCDYLNPSGLVSHSETGGNISNPVDKARLSELAPADDPTIPNHSRIPQSRIRK